MIPQVIAQWAVAVHWGETVEGLDAYGRTPVDVDEELSGRGA